MRRTWLVLLAACGGGDGKGGFLADAPPMIADAPGDGTGMIPCSDDSSLEPNDTVATAFDSQVDTQRTNIVLAGLSICATGDKDHYRVTVSTGSKSVEVIATMTSGAVPAVAFLNSGGASIANGTPSGTDATRTCIANLPANTYYALVQAPQRSNYRLSIAIVPGC
jgi:hypothetical protein